MSSSGHSPRILTPDATFAFPKQAVKQTSDSDEPPSLLTAILNSPKGLQSGILQKPAPILRADNDVGLGLDLKSEAHLKFAAQPHEHEVIIRPEPESDTEYPRRGSLRDSGYDEDSEDGFSSDDEFAFARPTNYKTFSQPTSRMTSPGTSPPPIRRGRGHIRVATATTDKACSRHCSPPPSRSASEAPPPESSPSARRVKRLPKTSESRSNSGSSSEEEENSPIARNGWRSDDPRLYEARRVVSSQTPSNPIAITTPRRASEHLPFRPLISHTSPQPSQSICPPVMTPATVSTALSRARSLGKVTFRDLPRRARPIECPPRSDGEDLGWTDAGKLAVRKNVDIDDSKL